MTFMLPISDNVKYSRVSLRNYYPKKAAVRSQALELGSEKRRNITLHKYFKY